MNTVCSLIPVSFGGVDFVSFLKYTDLADIRLMFLYIWI